METGDFSADDRTNVRSGTVALAAVLFAAIAVFIGLDVIADYRSGTAARHLLTEAAVMSAALGGTVVLWRQWAHARRRAARLTADLETARREAARFREDARDALKGLGVAIDRQFERWNLTAAEREVGLLLLKGLSHKEIAALRSTGETTIRQQSLAIYRKSGLRSRAELSACFLEDLLLPATRITISR